MHRKFLPKPDSRSLGLALISDILHAPWPYLIAPVLGAVIAVYTCRFTKGPNCCSGPMVQDAIDHSPSEKS